MIAPSAVAWKLKSIGAITSIVPAASIYTGNRQGVQLPYIAVDFPPGQQNLGEHSQGSGNFRKSPVVVYCYASSLEQAGTIAALVENNLAPQSGVTGTVTWNSISIDHCTLGQSYQHVEPALDGGEVNWRSMAVPVTVYHLVP